MFCFRLSFFPRGGGPGDRAGQPGRVGVGPGNRAGWIASGRAGQPSLQLAVRTGEPTCGSTGTPTGGSIGGSIVPTADAKFGPSTGPSTALQPTQSLVLLTGGSIVPTAEAKVGPSNRWFNRPYSRRKVRSSNRWFNRPYSQSKVRYSNRSSNRRSRQSCQCTSTEVADNATRFRKNSIGNPQNLCEVTHFYT